jgi:hypothetical protein
MKLRNRMRYVSFALAVGMALPAPWAAAFAAQSACFNYDSISGSASNGALCNPPSGCPAGYCCYKLIVGWVYHCDLPSQTQACDYCVAQTIYYWDPGTQAWYQSNNNYPGGGGGTLNCPSVANNPGVSWYQCLDKTVTYNLTNYIYSVTCALVTDSTTPDHTYDVDINPSC